MKYAIWFILIAVSFVVSGLLLRLINPNDQEGSNLLITTVAAVAVFIPLALIYLLATKKRKAKN